jgi:predicted transcriptional regulator
MFESMAFGIRSLPFGRSLTSTSTALSSSISRIDSRLEKFRRANAFRKSAPLAGEPSHHALPAEIARRSTLYDMKTGAITIRLDPGLEEMLDRVCRDTGRSRSEVVREALRRQLTLELLEEARRQLIPFAEAQGIYTDEDVFKLVS